MRKHGGGCGGWGVGERSLNSSPFPRLLFLQPHSLGKHGGGCGGWGVGGEKFKFLSLSPITLPSATLPGMFSILLRIGCLAVHYRDSADGGPREAFILVPPPPISNYAFI